ADSSSDRRAVSPPRPPGLAGPRADPCRGRSTCPGRRSPESTAEARRSPWPCSSLRPQLATGFPRSPRPRPSARVCVGRGGVGAAGGGGEVEVVGAGLGEGPAGELLDDVVDAAAGAQIARAGPAALVPGGGVVQVRVPGGLAAAGVAAGLVAGGDVVAEGGAGAVGG